LRTRNGRQQAAATTPQDRQEIVRLLLDRVTVEVEGESERVEVTLHWAGGFTSCHGLIRPVARYAQLSNYQPLRDRMDALRKAGCSFAEVAKHLNAEDFRPPKRTDHFTVAMLAALLSPRGPAIGRNLCEVHRGDHPTWHLVDERLARRPAKPLASVQGSARLDWSNHRRDR